MIGLAAEDLADLRRWAICGAVVVLAHGSIAAGMVAWREPVEGMGPAAGIVIEFAPVPVAPATVQSEAPPGPEADSFDSAPTKQIGRPLPTRLPLPCAVCPCRPPRDPPGRRVTLPAAA